MRQQLAAAIRRGDKTAADEIRAELERATRGPEKAIQPPRETR